MVTSLHVAVEALPDDVLMLPDTSGIMLAQIACGGPLFRGLPRYWVMQMAEL